MADEDKDLPHDVRPSFAADSFFAAARAVVQPQPITPPRPRPRRSLVAFFVVAALLIALPLADRQTSLLGNRLWSSSAAPTVELLTYCAGVARGDRERIEAGAVEMRRTDEGARLLAVLTDNGICIGTEELSYNAGYTFFRFTAGRGTVDRIVLDPNWLEQLAADEAAALLIHEATHADRLFAETSCSVTLRCEVLPNGVAVEEEVAAHAAEARFWEALHGSDGTRGGASWTGKAGARYLNELVAVANEGPDSFRAFVVEIRSDPREGEGIAGA